MIDGCVLTGAGSGIGHAAALRLAERKIPLILVGRTASNEKTRRMIEAQGGQAELFVCDLADYATLQPALQTVIAARGKVRWGVVLAASMLDPGDQPGSLADYEKVFRVNVLGNLAVFEACRPQMQAAGSGRVVFFAGGGAAYAYPAFPGYALSKVSTVRLVENLAAIHPPSSGLSFVCLAPGAVDTPMLARVVAAGGDVKTKTSIDEPVGFIEAYLASTSLALSGRYVHVRDNWRGALDGSVQLKPDQFLLRRVP